MMPESKLLSGLLEHEGPWTTAYIDGRSALPQVEEEARQEQVKNRLEECGAPAADIEALARVLPVKSGTPSPSARYLLARDGRVEVDEIFPGERLGLERVSSGPVPEIVPLLRHLAHSVRYLVIETAREGAEIRLERADQHAPENVENIEGRDDSLTKVQAGGWSHARYQRAAEEVWKYNQSEVAEVVDQLTREEAPDFIVLSGDVRARQMLQDQLGEAASRLIIEFDTHTRADGADGGGLEAVIAEAAAQHIRAEISEANDRASMGRGSAGAHGATAIVEALQQARVDTLVIDARLVADERMLHALDAPPWVAETEAESLDATSLGTIPIAEALARAAILTGARVLIREEEFASDDEPRTEPDSPEPFAALRWPETRES